MDDATARALNAVNRAFYSREAGAFAATRGGAWPGWERLWETLSAEGFVRDVEVLDVGCGNARLARFLGERIPGLRYLGVDASPDLLELARESGLPAGARLEAVDLVEGDLGEALAGRRFHLVAVFGVLHHVPGRDRREALLRRLMRLLHPGGLLAVTSWRLALFERFRDRVLPWEAWNARAELPVDPARLEPGDHLLPFGGSDVPRYVHFAHEDELLDLTRALGAERVATWTADGEGGNLNRYLVLRRAADDT